MKVLFVTSEKGLRGGERQLLLLARGLAQEGVETALVAPPGAALHAHFARRYEAPMANALDVRGTRAIARARRDFGAGLVHAFTARAHSLVALGAGPLVVTRSVAFAAGKSRFGRWKYRRDAQFLAVSRAAADTVLAAGADAAKVTVVPPAIDLEKLGADRARARAALGVAEGERVVGFVGALEREKAADVLLAALARVPGASAVLVGQGSLEPELRAQAERLGLGARVRFLGDPQDLGALWTGFDAYAQPSRAEGFGVAVAEAMAAGVPVVASRTGGLVELLGDGAFGTLVPTDDPAALAAALQAALAGSADVEARARRAREEARARYTVEAMTRATLEVYARAVSR